MRHIANNMCLIDVKYVRYKQTNNCVMIV